MFEEVKALVEAQTGAKVKIVSRIGFNTFIVECENGEQYIVE